MQKIIVFLVLLGLCFSSAMGQEKKDAKAQLDELISKVQTKLRAGKKTEADLTEELKAFDALLAEHKEEKTDPVARILFMKAMLYVQVLDDTEKGGELLKQLQKDFPETEPGKNAEKVIASIAKQAEAKKIQDKLVVGSQFPDFQEKNLEGKPISISSYKGKAVLVDFWATWCGPCVKELPSVLKAYEKHKGKGFDIIGISLDNDEKKLRDFISEKNMPWQQVFDGKGWESKLAQQYGINSIPATYLLDKEGRIVAKNLRGDDLEVEVAKLVGK